MGTPDFAVPTLTRLLAEQDVVGVCTQPDRPVGRGRRLAASPVKDLALRVGLPLLQPRSLRNDPAALAWLAELAPDVVVVAAYGLILPPAVLALAPGGALNVHASLLPRWRGAAPVARAILAGDTVTGVTIMWMDEGLDTGPMLSREALPIMPDETAGALTGRVAALGAELLAATLPRWLGGALTPEPQDDRRATLAPKLDKAEGQLDWREPASDLARRVRGLNPWPGAFTWLGGQVLKVHVATAIPAQAGLDRAVGTVVPAAGGPAVTTGAGWLRLDEVQGAGGKVMSGAAFARGQRGFVGTVLPSVAPERP